MTVRAARVLDGRGGSLANGVIEVRGSTIVAVDQRTGPVTYDLGDATVMPGMIDVHVHMNWYFGPGGSTVNATSPRHTLPTPFSTTPARH